jgi:hypothetical protein
VSLLPVNFPLELANSAFLSGSEAAWKLNDALVAVRWLGTHGYAVLGTELWLLRGSVVNSLPVGRSGLPEVHGSTVTHKVTEEWVSYVGRAAAETIAYLQAFNPRDIIQEGDLYFNVTWVSESESRARTEMKLASVLQRTRSVYD